MTLERLFKKLGFIGQRDKLVAVRSWRPTWDGKHICWPTLSVDTVSYRALTAPVWDRTRLRLLLTGKAAY